MRFLVVDDSNAMRMIMKRTLRQAGYDVSLVDTAESAEDALGKLAENTYDIVLSDWNMPGGRGIDMLRDMRAAGNETPVGFVTSESGDAVKNEALGAGAEFVVVKPFNADSITKALANVSC